MKSEKTKLEKSVAQEEGEPYDTTSLRISKALEDLKNTIDSLRFHALDLDMADQLAADDMRELLMLVLKLTKCGETLVDAFAEIEAGRTNEVKDER
jgi:hypothetical protein